MGDTNNCKRCRSTIHVIQKKNTPLDYLLYSIFFREENQLEIGNWIDLREDVEIIIKID